ncbi:MAG TPA: hypothetical protein VFH51_04375 [Myxococcota bacterium]|nr:hypothetical protein [Myxococcota bacterium]
MKIQNIVDCATALGLGALAVSKGAQAAPAADHLEVSARAAAPAPAAAALDIPAARNVARAPATKFSGSYQFDTYWPPCSAQPELVHMSFTYSGHYKDEYDAATNTYTQKSHFEGKGSGVGTSGTKYQLIQQDSGNYESTYDGTVSSWENNYLSHYKIVQQGSGEVYDYDAHYKYACDTVNGCRVQIDKFNVDCG